MEQKENIRTEVLLLFYAYFNILFYKKEVEESWKNKNENIGVLLNSTQPFSVNPYCVIWINEVNTIIYRSI